MENNNKIIIPFVAIALVMVLLVTGGLSYAYFTWWGTPGAVKATATDTFPGKANRTCSVVIKDAANISNACDLNMVVTYAGMGSSAYNTATPKFTKSCKVIVTVNGLVGDKVTYSVGLKAGTPNANMVTGYTFDSKELTYKANSGTETSLATITTSGTTIISSKTVTVATNNTEVTNTETITLNFYNLNKNQSPITSLNYSLCSNMNAAVEACHDNLTATPYVYYLYTPTYTCTLS